MNGIISTVLSIQARGHIWFWELNWLGTFDWSWNIPNDWVYGLFLYGGEVFSILKLLGPRNFMHHFRLSLISASDKIVLNLHPNNHPSSHLQYPSDLVTIVWNKVPLEPLGRQECLLAVPVFETGWGPNNCSGESPQIRRKITLNSKWGSAFCWFEHGREYNRLLRWMCSGDYDFSMKRNNDRLGQFLLLIQIFHFRPIFSIFYSSSAQDLWSSSFVLFLPFDSPQHIYHHSLLTASTCVYTIPFPSVSVSQDHFEVLHLRASTTVNPDAVTGKTCLDTTA